MVSPLSSRHHKTVLVSLLSFIFGFFFTSGSLAVPTNQSPYHIIEQVGRVMVLVENHYVHPVDRSKLLQGAIKGMVSELDPHSSYLTPKEYLEFKEDTEGKFVGIGVQVDARDGTIVVLRPIEDSPAERAGLKPGDRIEAIDDWPVQGKPLDRVVERIRGEPGSPVRLLIRRSGVDQPFEVEIVRGEVQVKSVVGKRMEANVAYVGIKQFQHGTHREFLEVLGSLRLEKESAIEGLILDLRTNPGGLVHESVQVADEFLSRGIIFSTRARGQTLDEVRAKPGGAATSLPLMVLVNEYTASAAELLAGAIQDHEQGLIVGAKTFGKGSVQSIVELPEGAALKLTTTLYFTPSGRSIQAEGIAPNIPVRQPRIQEGFAIMQERDMEGHLPSPTAKPSKTKEQRATSADIVILRDIPDNPIGKGDMALSVAYQLLVDDVIPKRKEQK